MSDPKMGRRASPAAFLFGLVMFAFPFLAVSCEGVPVAEFSGFQLAFGSQFQGEQVGPYPLVGLALACAAVGAVTGWLAYRKTTVVIGGVGAGTLLLFFTLFYIDLARESGGDVSVRAVSRVGFWLAVAAFVAGAAAASYWLPREERVAIDVSSGPEPGAP